LADSRRVDLPLGQEVAVEFTLAAPASGEHSLSVRLEDDSLPADNQRWLPLRVRSELSVLLVNGRPSGRPRDAATFFVEQALAPTTKERATTARWLRVTSLPESELPNSDLDQQDVVFLCDVRGLTEPDVERLRRFAQNGGGLIVSLGPSVSIETFNDVAFGANGFMSLSLTELMTATSVDGQPSVFGFDPGDFAHPLLREFRGNPGAGLETALIRQYVRIDVAQASPQSGSEVALRFSNGDPAIVTQRLGRGRCVLVTTSLDETWGEWAIWAAGFVPLMHELTQYAAAGRSQPREGLVGEPLVSEWPLNGDSASVVLTSPDQTTHPLIRKETHLSPILVIDQTTQPGLYSVAASTSPATTEHFAINVDPRESDPQRLDPRAWSESRDGTIVVRDAHSPLPTAPDAVEPETDSVSLGLLVAVLGLLFVEQALAWRFTAGACVALASLVLAAVWFAVRLLGS
jgi:hypothetical protein